jgi:hypothetical protein
MNQNRWDSERGAFSFRLQAIDDGAYRNKSERDIRGGGYVVESLEAALWCFYHTDSFRKAILRAVNLGALCVSDWPARRAKNLPFVRFAPFIIDAKVKVKVESLDAAGKSKGVRLQLDRTARRSGERVRRRRRG